MLVSFYNYAKSFKTGKYTGTFEELVHQNTQTDKVMFGGWCRHVDAYYNIPNMHIIRYEELLAVKILEILAHVFFKDIFILFVNYKKESLRGDKKLGCFFECELH
jgi:hypothetical protein